MKPNPIGEAFYRLLSTKLRAMRRDANISQEKMGELLGVSFQMVQKYESTGKTHCRPPIDRFLTWCVACGRQPVVVIHELEKGQ